MARKSIVCKHDNCTSSADVEDFRVISTPFANYIVAHGIYPVTQTCDDCGEEFVEMMAGGVMIQRKV
jgi:hypothetical protein